MLGNTYSYEVADASKTINEHSNERFEFWIMWGHYGTFILAFLVITIALNNILIGISVNIAKEGICQVELVSKELNHLAAILHVYAGGLIFMK